MLRIKADRMKDLEKFGFKLEPYYNFNIKHYAYCGSYSLSVLVHSENRTIYTPSGVRGTQIDDYNNKLYNLIKADMVEEVMK